MRPGGPMGATALWRFGWPRWRRWGQCASSIDRRRRCRAWHRRRLGVLAADIASNDHRNAAQGEVMPCRLWTMKPTDG